ncbi:16161_t:CDS:1, partial [Racocetra persica]
DNSEDLEWPLLGDNDSESKSDDLFELQIQSVKQTKKKKSTMKPIHDVKTK